jgi:hypothetical protein
MAIEVYHINESAYNEILRQPVAVIDKARSSAAKSAILLTGASERCCTSRNWEVAMVMASKVVQDEIDMYIMEAQS